MTIMWHVCGVCAKRTCVFFIQAAADRRSWPHGSGLMPVFEEDEESCDWVGEEGGHPAEEAHTETNVHNQDQQVG